MRRQIFILAVLILSCGCQGFFTGVRPSHRAEGAELATAPFRMPQDVPLLPDAHRKFIEDAGRSVRYLTYRSPEEIASFYRSAFAPMGMTEAAASKQAAVGDTSDLLFWGWPGGERLVVTIRSYLRRTKVKTYEIDVHLYGDD